MSSSRFFFSEKKNSDQMLGSNPDSPISETATLCNYMFLTIGFMPIEIMELRRPTYFTSFMNKPVFSRSTRYIYIYIYIYIYTYMRSAFFSCDFFLKNCFSCKIECRGLRSIGL
jgi:hypothetical protein